MLVYHCHKPVFTPKIAIFRRAGMREEGLPLPLTFQYLIFMIWRPYDLNLVMISSLASKCQHFKLRGLQFHSIKWLKNRHPNFKVCIGILKSVKISWPNSNHKVFISKESNIEKLVEVATLPLLFPPSGKTHWHMLHCVRTLSWFVPTMSTLTSIQLNHFLNAARYKP